MAEVLKDGSTVIMPLLTILIVAKPPKLLEELRSDNELCMAARSNANILIFCDEITEQDKEKFAPNQYILIVDAPGRDKTVPQQEYVQLEIAAGLRLAEVIPILIPTGSLCTQFKIVKSEIITTLERIHKKATALAHLKAAQQAEMANQ